MPSTAPLSCLRRTGSLVAWCLLSITLAAPVEELVEQGQRLIREKQYALAVAVLTEAKLSAPSDPRPYFYLGVALLESGQPRQAGPELQRAIELDPDQPEFPLLYAEVQTRLGLNSGASETLQVFQNPSMLEQLEPRELRLLTDLYLRLDAFEDALTTLDRFESLAPASPTTLLKRGEIYLNQRNYEKAAQSYQQAVEKNPQSALAYYGLGVTQWKQGHLENAREALLHALRLDPENIEYRYHLGLVYLDLQKPEEALENLEPLESLAGRFPPIYNALARAYRRTGDLKRSQEYFERFQLAETQASEHQNRQRRADSLVRQAVENLESGNITQARGQFEQALQLRPDHWTALKYLTKIHLASRDWGLTWAQLSRMEALRPDDFDVKSLAARYWYERSQAVRARVYAEAARRLNPGDAELRNLLGNIYLELGLRQEALQEYRAAVTLAPNRQDFRLNYESLAKP